MRRPLLYLAMGVLIGLAQVNITLGMYQIHHQPPTVAERESTVELVFEAPGINATDVQDAFLFYRFDGDVAYQQNRVKLRRAAFYAALDIPSGSDSSLEYYLQIQFADGSVQTYPAGRPSENPIRVEIVENRQEEKSGGKAEGIEYTILSPQQGEEVLPADVVIAITLFYEEETVDTTKSSFQLLLDGQDITSKADASEFFLTYVPDQLRPGPHSVSLRLNTGNESEEIAGWSFTVSNTARSLTLEGGGDAQGWAPAGQMELSARNQILAGRTNDVLSGNVRLSGQKEEVRYSAYGLLTSQEDPRLQTQNRYGAELYVGNWFELQAGHIYPMLSPLTISGQRVQGIEAGVHPLDHAFSLQFVYGKLRRQIANLYGPVQVQPQAFNDITVDTSYSLSIREDGFGTYERDLIGGRLGLGRGRNFQLGFNLLKVQDDTNSLDVIRNYRDLVKVRPEVAQNLSEEDRHKLENNPYLLQVDGNPVPKGNVVAGADLMFNLDNDRIRFRTDGALSLLNEDISPGMLTRERADELGFEIDPEIESLLDRLSWLIIINENMSSLPLRINTEDGSARAEAFFPKGIVATQSEASFNYLNNNLRVQYRWVGPDFNSLANTTVRRDIAGYTISDRFRLFDNRMYVTLGYENLRDNVIDNRDATTNTVTLRSNVSWYPIRQELPRVSVGLMSRSRENGIRLFNPYVTASHQHAAVRNYYEEQDGATIPAPTARMNSTIQFTSSVSQQFQLLGLSHDASLNYSLFNTSDDFFAYGDARSNSVSFNLTNRFQDLPLDTKIGFSINNTRTGSGLTNINIYGFNLGGSMFLLDDRLNVDAGVAFTKNRMDVTPLKINHNGTAGDNTDDFYEPNHAVASVSDSHSYIFNAGARYNIDHNHALVVNMRFTNVVSPLNNVQLPNDRIVQARYIFNF